RGAPPSQRRRGPVPPGRGDPPGRRCGAGKKKKQGGGARPPPAVPPAAPASTYAKPFASVNASSWAAVLPASRMWYPDTEIGCQRGISAVQNRIVSATMRIDGRGGEVGCLVAWYAVGGVVRGVPRR